MRLYLSSFRLGLYPSELVRMAGGRGARTAAIFNATDVLGAARDEHNKREMVDLRGIGLDPFEVDLRDFAGDSEQLREEVAGSQLIWVRGGNVFALRRAMLDADFDSAVKPMIESGQLAYGGYSAGVCVVTPTLRGLDLVDEADSNVPWDGMGLVGYSIAPHYKSDHPESAAIDDVVRYFEKNAIAHKTLRDGEVITIENGEETLWSFPPS